MSNYLHDICGDTRRWWRLLVGYCDHRVIFATFWPQSTRTGHVMANLAYCDGAAHFGVKF